MTTNFTLEHVAAHDISDAMLEETVNLFSSAYGIWGPLASEKMGKFCKPGTCIHCILTSSTQPFRALNDALSKAKRRIQPEQRVVTFIEGYRYLTHASQS